MPENRILLRKVAMAGLWLLLASPTAWSQYSQMNIQVAQPTIGSGMSLSLPVPKPGAAPPPYRLSANYDHDLYDFGYHRIKITVSAHQPVPTETEVAVECRLRFWNDQPVLTVSELGVIAAGESDVTLNVRFPGAFSCPTLEIETRIDNRIRRELAGIANLSPNSSSQSYMKVLDASSRGGGQQLPDAMRQNANIVIDTGALSTNWLDLTQYDVVHLAASDLAAVEANNLHLAALRTWVKQGGSLWVSGADTKKLATIDRVLGTASDKDPAAVETSDGEELQAGWQFVYLSNRPANDQDTMRGSPVPEQLLESLSRASASSRGWFVERGVGFGFAVAFVGPQPTAKAQLTQSLAMEHWANRGWLIRHGFSPSEGNSDFSNWLVPGVGQAPVVEFQVLITLFVLAIGPLNYWLLQRSGRLHLLVVTVPLGALLLTGGLLLYGIISDGFYTKVRIHSVTLLDQQQGEAVTQSRLSYYASLSPADGLRFRDTTAIYSINPSYSDRFAMNSGQPRLELRWREQQHLSRGWLRSRTPTQYFTQSVTSTDKSVEIRGSEDKFVASNNLGSDISLLIIRQPDGNFSMASNIKPSSQVALTPTEATDVSQRFSSLVSSLGPAFPTGYDAAMNRSSRYDRRNRRRSYYQASGSMDQSLIGFDDNRMNDLTERWRRGFTGPDSGIQPGEYLAICQQTVASELGLEGVLERGSLHLVWGQWNR